MTWADDDFPAPQAVEAAVADDVAKASAAYVASPEFAQFKHGHVVGMAFERLNGLAAHDGQAVAWACYDWLQIHEAGTPYVAMIEGAARDDARFWAETAHPAELECYALAAMDRLADANAMFASRQIKRLVGALWRRMAPNEQEAFKAWLAKEDEK
jgi:hypothetical protein